MILRRFLMVWLGAVLAWSAPAATTTKARLVLPVESVKAGESITVGILLEMAPGWHTYWKNSGESGIATKISWTLPEGVTAGEIQWPAPEKYEAEGLITYVLHDQAMLLVPLSIGPGVTGDIPLQAKVSWLECDKECIPGHTEVSASLKIGTENKPSAEAALLKKWQAKMPSAGTVLNASAYWTGSGAEGKRPLTIAFTPTASAQSWDFFPYRGADYDVENKTEKSGLKNGSYQLLKNISSDEKKWPKEIAGLIVGGSNSDKPTTAYEVTIPIKDKAPVIATASTSATGGTAAAPPTRSIALMLFYAFLGGIILNIMPCVLPVISLKILGFVHQSQQDPGRVRMLGLIYGLGVIVSFLVLAGLVIAVQQAGKSASWGMQFQNPQFLIVLTILVTLVALNLFGLFEVTLGGNVMGAAGQLAAKKGASGAFFNGVLATLLATPCTAPFLGVSLGFAFAQPPVIIVLFFVTVALGLAAPYVILSWEPKWLKFLPKPGAWMERFKILMGFPMLATAFWLLSLAAGHFGRSGVLWLGLLLVLIGLAAYIFGEFVQRGSKHRGLAGGLSVALLFISLGYVLEGQLHWRSPEKTGTTTTSLESKVGIVWKNWSNAAVMEARKNGQPVFVDFTADWCLTCQANKKTSIEIASVKQKLDEIGAVCLLGDYTDEDTAIDAELKKYGRAGVPLVIVFPADPDAAPIVLPELLTPNIVLNALDKAAPKQLSSAK